jgi:hypothetical protein
MYKAYISNIIYNVIFSARIIILASLMEIKHWLYTISLKTSKIREEFKSSVSESETEMSS